MNRVGYFGFSIVLALLFVRVAAAQEAITLAQSLKLAHEQAPALVQAKEAFNTANWNIEASNMSRRSTVDLTLSAPIYSDNTSPIYNPVTGTTDLLTARQAQFGGLLAIRQPIYWTGGSIELDGSLFKRAQTNVSGNALNDYLGIGSVSVTQPIFVANKY